MYIDAAYWIASLRSHRVYRAEGNDVIARSEATKQSRKPQLLKTLDLN
jgi:hypothetical protein